MSSFVIKIIAIITMFLDHASDAIIGHLSTLNVIGRIAFPLFAFQLVIGYCHTKNIKKYLLRLIAFALISQVPFSILIYNITGSFFMLNIFFTLAIGLTAIYIYDSKKLNIMIKTIIIISLLVIAQLLRVDYQAWGVFLILFIRMFYPKLYCKDLENNNKHFTPVFNNKYLNYIAFVLGFLILCIIRFKSYFNLLPLNWLIAEIVFTFLPIIFMLFYNGKKGPSLQYFFYAFYPAHLLILDCINLVIKLISQSNA